VAQSWRCLSSSMASKATLQRSLRSRWSVKDVPEHFVKDVMELDTLFQLWDFSTVREICGCIYAYDAGRIRVRRHDLLSRQILRSIHR